ncbi:hypothetical protein PA05_1741 [Cutibacterium acnes P05]|nr:hypothetical protein [Cutibacterium acnes P05]
MPRVPDVRSATITCCDTSAATDVPGAKRDTLPDDKCAETGLRDDECAETGLRDDECAGTG